MVSGVLLDVGVRFSQTDWDAIASVNRNNGVALASQLSQEFASLSNQNDIALQASQRLEEDDTPGLTKLIPNLISLPTDVQSALLDAYYQSPKNFGPIIEGDAKAGDVVGVAEQLALNTGQTPPATAAAATGTILRNLVRAVVALGGTATVDPTNLIVGVTFPSGPNAALQNAAAFLSDVLAGAGIADGSRSPLSYFAAFGNAGINTSFNNLLVSLQSTLNANGIAVVPEGGTLANVATLSPAAGISAQDIAALNQMSAGEMVVPGQIIALPTQVFSTLPLNLSSSFDYVYDPTSGRTIASPNPEGFGGLTLQNSVTGGFEGIINLDSGAVVQQQTSNGSSSLVVQVPGGKTITYGSDGHITATDARGSVETYQPGSSVSVGSDGAIDVKASSSSLYVQIDAPSSDPFPTSFGASVTTDDLSSIAFLNNVLGQIGQGIDPSTLNVVGATRPEIDGQGNQYVGATYSGTVDGVTIRVTISAPLSQGVSGYVQITRSSGGSGYTESFTVNPDGSLGTPELTTFGLDGSGNSASASPPVIPTNQPEFTPDQIGVVFGSTLGSLLAKGNSLLAIPISAGLGITLGSFVQIVESSQGGDVSGLVDQALKAVPAEVLAMGASAITSYLTAEALNAAGVKGFAAQTINVASNVTIGRIAANLATGQDPFSNIVGPSNLDFAVGSFIGTEIGSLILPATSQAGSIGGSLGAAVTGIALLSVLGDATASSGTAAFLAAAGVDTVGTELATNAAVQGIADALGIEAGTLLNFAIPVVGALVGYLIGTELGNLIGGTPSPQAFATIGVERSGADNATFAVDGYTSKDKGPVALVQNLAQSTTGALNGILAEIGGRVVNPSAVVPFIVGVRRGIASFRTGQLSNDYHFSDVGQLQTYAVSNALNQILTGGGIAGGDIYAKRVLASFLNDALTNRGYNPLANGQNASPLIAGDLGALTGDLSIAQSYARYVANPDVINALIAASPNSAFAAGWLVTLQAADALGLNRRSASDWTGGWGQYLATIKADPEQLGASLANNARVLSVAGAAIPDTIATSAKDVITDTAANDTISISASGVLAPNANAQFDGAAATTARTSHIAAVIYVGPGSATVYAGGQGDDVVGGTGNQYLAAGSYLNGAFTQSLNATWLFAGTGNDTLQGGASGGDVLQAGAGNDLLRAGAGSAWLIGGAGSDTLVGGNAGDILQAGQGATLIEAGAGDDTIVFGFGDGTALVTNTGGLNNELSLGAGITWANIEFARPNATDLEVELLGANQTPTGDAITLADWFNAQNQIQWLRFADGTKIRLGDFHFIFGSPGNNNLVGLPGLDWIIAGAGFGTIDAWLGDGVLNAGTGDDSISGGMGPDTILGRSARAARGPARSSRSRRPGRREQRLQIRFGQRERGRCAAA